MIAVTSYNPLKLFALLIASCLAALAQKGEVQNEVVTITKNDHSNFKPPVLSPEELERLRDDENESERPYDPVIDNPPSPPGRPLVRDEPVGLIAPHLLAPARSSRAAVSPASDPGDFVLGASRANPNLSGTSIVVEPSVSNQAKNVVFLSNDRADYSTDGGATFNTLTIPTGPAKAPIFCCDQSIVYDRAHSIWIWSTLDKSKSGDVMLVQISVIRNLPTVECTYVYDPGRTANDIKVDYPQLGLGDNKFYLSTSESRNGSWYRARMLRFDLDDINSCPATVVGRAVGWLPANKRMWTPIRGAKEIMYWANLENTTQLRVWTWPESDNAATWVLKSVQPTTFANPDCRGGANNKDWMEKKGWHITEGFMRGALGRGGVGSSIPAKSRLQFYWNGANDATHLQAYVRSAVFDLPDLNLIDEPNIHNDDFCFGYADVHPNARGDFAVVVAFGGKAGGNGRALGSGVGIEDEFTPRYRLKTVYVTSDGTDMPSSKNKSRDQRFGDYLSVKPHEPCELWWVAGTYALTNGGTSPAGTYVEFGRYRDKSCWERWKDITPPLLP
jgi:hypothetical protein